MRRRSEVMLEDRIVGAGVDEVHVINVNRVGDNGSTGRCVGSVADWRRSEAVSMGPFVGVGGTGARNDTDSDVDDAER